MPRRKVSETRQARRFGVILTLILLALASLSLWRAHPVRGYVVLTLAAVVLGCTFLAFPLWLRFFRRWMQFALVLSWISTRVLLSLFYYLILSPVGIVMKLLGRAPMDLAWRDGRESYWIVAKEKEFTLERYRKPF